MRKIITIIAIAALFGCSANQSEIDEYPPYPTTCVEDGKNVGPNCIEQPSVDDIATYCDNWLSGGTGCTEQYTTGEWGIFCATGDYLKADDQGICIRDKDEVE